MRWTVLILTLAGCAGSSSRHPLHFERHFVVFQRAAIIGPEGLHPVVFKAVEVYPFTGIAISGDTLLVSVQHFRTYADSRILEQSRSADLFIACHPERMTVTDRRNHIFPDAKGLIGVIEFTVYWNGRPLHAIAVVTDNQIPKWVLVLAQTGKLRVIQP